MKNLLKYITLLLVSGVIIPFYYQHKSIVETRPVTTTITKLLSPDLCKNDNAYLFSFTNDVLAKLLPEIKYFQIPL